MPLLEIQIQIFEFSCTFFLWLCTTVGGFKKQTENTSYFHVNLPTGSNTIYLLHNIFAQYAKFDLKIISIFSLCSYTAWGLTNGHGTLLHVLVRVCVYENIESMRTNSIISCFGLVAWKLWWRPSQRLGNTKAYNQH